MVKQTIEIEVPEGKKAVWEDGKVVFEDIDPMESIKTVQDAVEFLLVHDMCKDITAVMNALHPSTYEWKVAAYRAVVAAVTQNEKRHLINGERWYPTIEFCYPNKLKNCYGKNIIGQIKSEGDVFDVVGGSTTDGAGWGLGSFAPYSGIGRLSTSSAIRSVGSRKASDYISQQFGKLLFEVIYGGTNCDWKWLN